MEKSPRGTIDIARGASAVDLEPAELPVANRKQGDCLPCLAKQPDPKFRRRLHNAVLSLQGLL